MSSGATMTDVVQTGRQWEMPDEEATRALAVRVAGALEGGMVFYLNGPTYSLIEGYVAQGRPAWHLDLYRIADPAELEWLGLDALSDPAAIVLVEWPERGAGALPAADLDWHLDYLGDGRQAKVRALTARGERVLSGLAA
jgi:tRNA threonylcarbamoyladenosine biosynthesis protein TsaE